MNNDKRLQKEYRLFEPRLQEPISITIRLSLLSFTNSSQPLSFPPPVHNFWIFTKYLQSCKHKQPVRVIIKFSGP